MTVVVIGAGIVGAACADALAAAGRPVVVLERGAIASGTTGSGEGNILVSDKEPGPELALALLSRRLWSASLPDEVEAKGGLVVAYTADSLVALTAFAAAQRAAGVTAEVLTPEQAWAAEPHLTRDLAGAVWYPQDAQVQPARAAAALLRRARAGGARVYPSCPVTGISGGTVHTPRGAFEASMIVTAAGLDAPEIARLAGSSLPVAPRRGYILVTAPVPPLVRAKVYDAAYVSNVVSSGESLQTSTVVERTDGGTILIGASRERVGLDPRLRVDVLARLARQAVRLFPVLGKVPAIRAYKGFRPYCPDHLPVIARDPAVPGLVHAAGHEGAGIGLALGTAHLVRCFATGEVPLVDPAPFRLDRPSLAGYR
jgi:glycine/D-amino acid oxidase-like deaminating enzyme